MRSVLVLVVALVMSGCAGEEPADTGSDDPGQAAVPDATATADPKEPAQVTLPEGAAAPTDDPSALPDPPTDAASASEPTPTDEVPDVPDGRYVRIDAVALDDQAAGAYSVTFEPFGFQPLIGPGPEDFHVHFFFDTVAPEDAGTNGQPPGEWFLYDGPSPFTGYTVTDRPEGATRMCALVADAAHAITVGTGNCVDLP